MWNNLKKAITFSFDDGITQDVRLIQILDKYNLKATFNLNSGLLGQKGELFRNEVTVSHNKINPCDVKNVYANHEVAVHTLTHPNLKSLSNDTIKLQIEEDRKILEDLCDCEVVGMAYPCGNYDERVVEVLRNQTKIKYARTVSSTYDFNLCEDSLVLNPTVHFIEVDKMFELAQKFLLNNSEDRQMFYVWGHSFELDANLISWEKFEEFCKLISNNKDVFYGTNKQVVLEF